MKNRLFQLLLLTTLSLFASDGAESLLISLPTRHHLTPVSVAPLPEVDSHLETLRSVLIDDINRNGSCTVREDGETSKFFIKVELMGEELLVSITSKKLGLRQTLPLATITGHASSDRRVIHRVSDHLTEIMTGKRGIASTNILYALQLPERSEEGTIWKSEIWEIDYDGHNAHQITHEESYCITPLFFPVEGEFTKNKFLYVNYKLGQPKIYIGSRKESKGVPFVKLRGNQLLPALSMRGDMIAFISDASGRADLFVQAFSRHHGLLGVPIQAFSFPRSVQASPTFRPDGKKIAFVSDKEGTPRIFLIDTPSPGKRRRARPLCITKKYSQNTSPNWSPDGTKLAYSAMIDGSRQILVYDFLSREEIQLTNGRVHKENPSWAPDSLHIIYNTVDLSSSELYLIDIKQKVSLQITSGAGKKHYPAWEPRQI
ncbi:MAG: Protein TolB [Chlamydiae bacterium]|nr:Protein TolB [Chlamydiota bacterium]